MMLVWTVENQDAAGKWFRVTPKLFENRFDAIEWCNTLRERCCLLTRSARLP